MDREQGESPALAGNAFREDGGEGGVVVAARGDNKRQKKLLRYCSSPQCRFFCRNCDVHIQILSSQGDGGFIDLGKEEESSQTGRWQMKPPPTETYITAFIHVSGRLLVLNMRSSHLNLIKRIIKRRKSFLTHMNRIAKLPTFGNSISIAYQTQLNFTITGGEKKNRKMKKNTWSKSEKYLVKSPFQETSGIYPVSQH